MKKTTVYLDEDIDRALARLAAERGLTKAELIRHSLAATASAASRPRLSVAAGEGPGGIAADVDRCLEQTGFGRT